MQAAALAQAAQTAQTAQAAQTPYAGRQPRPASAHQPRPASAHQPTTARTNRTASRQAIPQPPDAAGPAASAGRPTRRQVARPGRRGASGGAILLLLALATVLVALGAGFFGLASLSREGVATPQPTTPPTAQPTTQPAAPANRRRRHRHRPAPHWFRPPNHLRRLPRADQRPDPSADDASNHAARRSANRAAQTRSRSTHTHAAVRNVAVPTLRGKSLDDARTALQAAELTLIVRG